MSDSLDSYISNWASKYSGYTPPSKSDSTATVPGTKDKPDTLPPVPPPPSGRADPSDPTSMPSSGQPDPYPNTWTEKPPPYINPQPMPRPDQLPPPATPDQLRRYQQGLPAALQPQVGVPGGGGAYAPSIQNVATAAQPVDESGRNNPGNIRVPGTSRFASFPTMQAGIDAIGNQIQTYQDRDGINTLAGVIAKYSPPNENPTKLLIQRAAARTGLDPFQPIDLHNPVIRQKVVNAILAQEGGGAPGVQDVRDEIGMPRQYLVAPTEREAGARFRPDPNWNSDEPGMRPSSWDIPRIMSGPVPQLLALASIFARVPLINAIAAYGSMAKAQQNGQLLDYQMQKDQWNFNMKKHQDIETLEGQAVDDALEEFKGNPDDMKAAMLGIARQYNDPNLNMLAQQERFDVIEQLQKRRDMLNQPLQKMLLEKERVQLEQQRIDVERQKLQTSGQTQVAIDKAVAADDAAWLQTHQNATQEQKDQAHFDHLAKRTNELKPKGGKAAVANPYLVGGGDGADSGDTTGTSDAGTGADGDTSGDTGTGTGGDTGGDTGGGDTGTGGTPDTGDQGAAAPAKDQPQVASGAPADSGPTAPYQEASREPTPPPSGTAAAGQPAPPQAQPLGPDMRKLTPGGQEIARQYLRGGEDAMRMVPPNFRQPILDGAMEMQRGLDAIPDSMTGRDNVLNAVRKVDPGVARLLDLLLRNKQGEPSGGRMGQTSAAFWTRMNELGVQADSGWSPQQYTTLQAVRNSYGPQGRMGQTLNRSDRLSQLAKRLWDDAKGLPDNPVPANELQRWFESGIAGDPKYTQFAFDWHNFAVESQAVVTGGQPTVTLSRLILDTLQHGANPAMVRTAIQSDLAASIGAIDSSVNGYRQSFPEERLPGTYNQGGYDQLYRLYHGNAATGDLANPIPQIGDRRTDGKTYVGGDPLNDRNWR